MQNFSLKNNSEHHQQNGKHFVQASMCKVNSYQLDGWHDNICYWISLIPVQWVPDNGMHPGLWLVKWSRRLSENVGQELHHFLRALKLFTWFLWLMRHCNLLLLFRLLHQWYEHMKYIPSKSSKPRRIVWVISGWIQCGTIIMWLI